MNGYFKYGLSALLILLPAACNRAPETQEPAPRQAADVPPPPDPAAIQAAIPAFFDGALNGDTAAVTRGLGIGVPADLPDMYGRTALMLAGFNGHIAAAQALLNNRADLNARDQTGRTPLMYACTGPYPAMAELLIKRGAEINVQDAEEGWTPLMYAAAEGHAQVVRVLMDHGATTTFKDKDGETARDFALQRGHLNVARQIEEHPNAR